MGTITEIGRKKVIADRSRTPPPMPMVPDKVDVTIAIIEREIISDIFFN